MEYRIIVANPAGNITVFVLDDVPQPDFIPLAQKLMNRPELQAEQVGYLKPPRLGGAARLEMMGGEFCGNATRSFGMLTAQRQGKAGKVEITVECSGSAEPLPVSVDFDAGEAETVMPRPLDLITLDGGELGELSLVFFEGILHVIAPGRTASEELFHQIRLFVEARYTFDALGVMFFDASGPAMDPAVFVKTTETLVFESSCGSGTVATAVWLCRDMPDGTAEYRITQPGGVLKATVEKRGGAVASVRMGGPVTFGSETTISL